MILSLLVVLPALWAIPLRGEIPIPPRETMTQAFKEIETSFPVVEGAVVSVIDQLIYTDLTLTSGLRPGSELSVFREGEEILHPLTRQVLGRFEIPLGTVHLTQVAASYAAGELGGKPGDEIKPGDRVRTTSGRLRAAVLTPSIGAAAVVPPWLAELSAALERTTRFTPVVPGAPVPPELPGTPLERMELARAQGADVFFWAVPDAPSAGALLRLTCYSGATGLIIASTTVPLAEEPAPPPPPPAAPPPEPVRRPADPWPAGSSDG